MAAEILGCGENRVWIDPDPDNMKQVADCITRNDIRIAINWGLIQAKQKKGISSGRRSYAANQKAKGRQRGQGTRKGAKYARTPRKREWIRRIRPIRGRLQELKQSGVLDNKAFRQFYKQAKGGMFKSKGHLNTQLKIQGYLKEEAAQAKTEGAK
jgi:large subunit ribosomal protein L19e